MLSLIVVSSCNKGGTTSTQTTTTSNTITVEESPDFIHKSPKEGLLEALHYYAIEHSEIVYAQAILETGWFNSDICIRKNNLFGLYDSKTNSYITYNHWVESVLDYDKYIQSKYKNQKHIYFNDYYRFLQDIGYARDSNYIHKIKSIVKKNDTTRSRNLSAK